MNHNQIVNADSQGAYVYKDKKKLRFGYTTGSCSAAAAKAAAVMLLTECELMDIELMTPKGFLLKLAVQDVQRGDGWVSCGIQKYSGDDPDVTDGMLIYAKVCKVRNQGIVVDGGAGIGRVTKQGLCCEVGTAAINPVPRKMIIDSVQSVCEEYEYRHGLEIVIYAPQGADIAKKTFNERLGIVGGISILGTSGIVEPMSEQALIDTIKAEMNVLKAANREVLIVTLGNYGEDFLKNIKVRDSVSADELLPLAQEIDLKSSLKCSNFIGETIQYAAQIGLTGLLFVGHIGKMVKTAGGILNTHSKNGDCRLELLAAHGAAAGVSKEKIIAIMEAVTTEEAVGILIKDSVWNQVIQSLLDKSEYHMQQFAGENLKIGAIFYSNKYGFLGGTKNTSALIAEYKNQEINRR